MQLWARILLIVCVIGSILGQDLSLYTDRAALMRRIAQKRDRFGCDVVIPSCGPKGKCCDEHDACFKIYGCRAISAAWSWIPGAAIFERCALCNAITVFCIANPFLWPGPSECCSAGNCGQPRPRNDFHKFIL